MLISTASGRFHGMHKSRRRASQHGRNIWLLSTRYKVCVLRTKIHTWIYKADVQECFKNQLYWQWCSFPFEELVCDTKQIFSCGCFVHKYNMHNLAYHHSDFHFDVLWTFSTSGHGKGLCDGVGAAIKPTATNYLLKGGPTAAFSSPKELFEW